MENQNDSFTLAVDSEGKSDSKILEYFILAEKESQQKGMHAVVLYQWILNYKQRDLEWLSFLCDFSHLIYGGRIFATQNFALFSPTKKENFYSLYELVLNQFGRSFDDFCNGPKQDWKQLTHHLRSPLGSSGYQMSERVSFLQQDTVPYRVMISTNKRCGSNLIRKIMELIFSISIPFNIVEGPEHLMLLHSMLAGSEGHLAFGKGEWIVKSCYPYESVGYQLPYHKIIVSIRNPFDYLVSAFLLDITENHELVLQPPNFEATFPKEWQDYIEAELSLYIDTVNFWMNQRDNHQIPVLFVRYEDLILDKAQTMTELVKYVLGENEIRGTIAGQRLKKALEGPHFLYKVKPGGIYKHLNHFSEQQKEYVIKTCSEVLVKLHYIAPNATMLKNEEELNQEAKTSYFMKIQKSEFSKAVALTKAVDEGKPIGAGIISDLEQFDQLAQTSEKYPQGRGKKNFKNIFLHGQF